ncbi:MAG: hypothetical protein U5L75_03180 [Candidatus Campbellbacteria bacterium]|nr:hypothetical protein [Candidatus Campbellbacteria bacterium]
MPTRSENSKDVRRLGKEKEIEEKQKEAEEDAREGIQESENKQEEQEVRRCKNLIRLEVKCQTTTLQRRRSDVRK